MLLGKVFERFVAAAPICVAARAAMEAALGARELDDLFARVAERQYTRTLLFSTCVELMAAVVCRVHGSLHAAYHGTPERIGVSLRALYSKIEHIEPHLSAELVRHTARRLAPVIRAMRGESPAPRPGYRIRIVDGNHLAATQRRLKPLRDVAAGPLPGLTLVVLDPQSGLALDVACCEDGHAQERTLLAPILAQAAAGDLWIADRGFCTTGMLFDLHRRGACFLIRQHASTLQWERQDRARAAGRAANGTLRERTLWLLDRRTDRRAVGDEAPLPVRQITLTLDRPTRSGETEIHLLTNLPRRHATPRRVAELYHRRWTIETLFQNLTTILRCEVDTLAYPRAALFGFCAALAASNVYATVKASLRATHGVETVERNVSDYFLAAEIAGKYEGMMIAIPESHWRPFARCTPRQLAALLKNLAARAHLPRFQKHPRGPKKPRPRRTRFAKTPHISTAKLLARENQVE